MDPTADMTPNAEKAQDVLNAKPEMQSIQQQFQENVTPQEDVRGYALGNTLRGIAVGIDTISSVIPVEQVKLGKEPKQVLAAREGFGSMKQTIDQDIALYKEGKISYAEVQSDIDQALTFTNKLYSFTKGKGQANLGYWLDQGASIEAEVQQQIKTLERQRAALGL
jgi:hypothetical protein